MNLFPEHGHGDVGDDLDRFYTPDKLALAVVHRVANRLSEPPKTVLEPSVGGGSFVRAVRKVWPEATVTGFDMDPMARGLALCDHAVVGDFEFAEAEQHDLLVGNPPFGNIREHLPRAISLGAAVALIMPWSLLGGVETWEQMWVEVGKPHEVWPVMGRPWQKNIRETAAYFWRPELWSWETTIGTPLVWK